MKLKELKEILNNPMINDELEIGYPDNSIEPIGIEPIERIAGVYDDLGNIVGYAIV